MFFTMNSVHLLNRFELQQLGRTDVEQIHQLDLPRQVRYLVRGDAILALLFRLRLLLDHQIPVLDPGLGAGLHPLLRLKAADERVAHCHPLPRPHHLSQVGGGRGGRRGSREG